MRKFGKNDIIYLSILTLVLLLSLFVFYRMAAGETGSQVSVTVDGTLYGSYRLDTDQTIEIRDESGRVTNVLEIVEGSARMQDAECPDHLCVQQRPISREHENIVCLPNRVVVTVDHAEKSELDAVVK